MHRFGVWALRIEARIEATSNGFLLAASRIKTSKHLGKNMSKRSVEVVVIVAFVMAVMLGRTNSKCSELLLGLIRKLAK